MVEMRDRPDYGPDPKPCLVVNAEYPYWTIEGTETFYTAYDEHEAEKVRRELEIRGIWYLESHIYHPVQKNYISSYVFTVQRVVRGIRAKVIGYLCDCEK